jgi:hypothetical protein
MVDMDPVRMETDRFGWEHKHAEDTQARKLVNCAAPLTPVWTAAVDMAVDTVAVPTAGWVTEIPAQTLRDIDAEEVTVQGCKGDILPIQAGAHRCRIQLAEVAENWTIHHWEHIEVGTQMNSSCLGRVQKCRTGRRPADGWSQEMTVASDSESAPHRPIDKLR